VSPPANLLTMFSGVILTGGGSRRMGRDKAFIDVPLPPSGAPDPAPRTGPLVLVPANALRGAGAYEVLCIGGDEAGLRRLGLTWHADDHPGDGPLGGLITALRTAALPVVVVLTCDLVRIDAPSVRGLAGALDRAPDAQGAMPVLDGRRQILTAAYRRTVLPTLEAAFAAGERSVRRALEGVEIATVEHLDPEVLVDVDSPGDLDKYAPGFTPAKGTPLDIPEIDVAALADLHATGATIIDVRNPDEYETAHVPGAALIPLPEVPERIGEIPTDGPVYVICAVGGRSRKACELLAAQGHDATNIAGGTNAWVEAGYEVNTGPTP